MLPRGADAAAGDLDRADLHVRRGNAPPGPFPVLTLVDGQMDLSPDAPARPAMLAGVPFSFAPDLDAGAVYYPAGHHAVMSRKGTSRCSGPPLPRSGSCTAKVFCRRHSVETEEDQRAFQWKDRPTKGTGPSSPASFSRLATNPVVCRSGRPNRPGAPPVQG